MVEGLPKYRGMLRKVLISDLCEQPLPHKVLRHQWKRLIDVWNNDIEPKSDAIGIERMLRLCLVGLQFIFPGIYVRAFFGRRGSLAKNLGIELYVVLKISLAIGILYFQPFVYFSTVWYRNPISYLVLYMAVESLLYTATLVLCNDIFAAPRSYKRNIILLLCDYVEVILDFASLYLIGSALKYSGDLGIVKDSLAAAYFSFVTSVTVGYGDIVVANSFGQKLVILQTIVFLLYGALFFNFYISRLEEPKPATS